MALALVGAGVVIGTGAFGDTGSSEGKPRAFSAVPGPTAAGASGLADGVPTLDQRLPPYQREVAGRGHLTAYFRNPLGDFYDRPGGRVTRTVPSRTEFGSLRVLSVARRA